MNAPTRKLRIVPSKPKSRFPVPVPPIKRRPVEDRRELSDETRMRVLSLAIKETR